MKIYTKTGDLGETALFGGERVKKSHPRVRTYGTLDEANSTLGLAISYFQPKQSTEALALKKELVTIQEDLFQVGSELASPKLPAKLQIIQETDIARLEHQIDAMETKLTPLKCFILPGGTPLGATLHLARTIVRRGERECVEMIDEMASKINIRPEVIRYLNRLSDYLFVAARFANHLEQTIEHPWIPRS